MVSSKDVAAVLRFAERALRQAQATVEQGAKLGLEPAKRRRRRKSKENGEPKAARKRGPRPGLAKEES